MLAALLVAGSSLVWNVASGEGLTVSWGSTPLVLGSGFQLYEEGWSKGLYSSLYTRQQVERGADGVVTWRFRSDDGLAGGEHRFEPTRNGVRCRYSFSWQGDHPVYLELTGARVWAPGFQAGRMRVDGQTTRGLAARTYDPDTQETRTYGSSARRFELTSPLGRLTMAGDTPRWSAFDARGWVWAWPPDAETWWVGTSGVRLDPGVPVEIEFTISFRGAEPAEGAPLTIQEQPVPIAVAREAGTPPALFAPWGDPLRTTPVGAHPEWELPDGASTLPELYAEVLAALWERTPPGPGTRIVARVDRALEPEEFVLSVGTGVTLHAGSGLGLRHGVMALATSLRPVGGELAAPVGELRSKPRIAERAIHLFVGPTALEFHTRLMRRVLAPLRLNAAVLQCERTDWLSAPGIATDITMSREDLAALFRAYRANGFEPTPLIQSFGHMEWLFANGQNLGLALNREQPYAVDPDLPEAQAKLAAIWEEAIDLLEPRRIHFGLDETDMIGWARGPEEMTRLWRKQLTFLGELAAKHRVQPMLWGDMALAPGQAVDAMNGHSPEQAQLRRDALPRGAVIADWHYAANPDPEAFRRSLALWKAEGFRPVASAWFDPVNITSFADAAALEGAGFLQTTWAGYESSEKNALAALDQAGAYVLAGQHTWQDDPPVIDPQQTFLRLYGLQPEPIDAMPGRTLGSGEEFAVGGWRFRRLEAALGSVTTTATSVDAVIAELPTPTSIVLALDTLVRCRDGEPVALAVLEHEDGTDTVRELVYGRDVRAAGDPRGTPSGPRENGLTALVIDVNRPVTKLTLQRTSPHAGLRLHGITMP